jgi:isoamylase
MDDSFYVIFNAYHEAIDYKLPVAKYGKHWKVALNTASTDSPGGKKYEAESLVNVAGRSIMVLQNKINHDKSSKHQ